MRDRIQMIWTLATPVFFNSNKVSLAGLNYGNWLNPNPFTSSGAYPGQNEQFSYNISRIEKIHELYVEFLDKDKL